MGPSKNVPFAQFVSFLTSKSLVIAVGKLRSLSVATGAGIFGAESVESKCKLLIRYRQTMVEMYSGLYVEVYGEVYVG